MKFKQTDIGGSDNDLFFNSEYSFPFLHILLFIRTEFCLTLHSNNQHLSGMTETKLKILVVEDNQENRDVMAMFIRGMAVYEFATNGEEALTKTEQNLYDIILMDINLGMGLTGIDVTKLLRQRESYKSTPIVAVTAYSLFEDQKKILDAGCSHYVGKPFTRKQLHELIAKIAADYHLSGTIQ